MRFWACLLVACGVHALLFLPLNLPVDRVVRLEITLASRQSEIATTDEVLPKEGAAEERIISEAIKETQLQAIAEPKALVGQPVQLGDWPVQAVEPAAGAVKQQHETKPTGKEAAPEAPVNEEAPQASTLQETARDKPSNADILLLADKLQELATFNITQMVGLKAPSNTWQRNLQPSKIKRLANDDVETIAEQYYLQSWRRKVQAIGKRNYPAKAKLLGLSGSLRLLVSVRHDGTLIDTRVLISSGHDTLDDAAMKIISLASPFAPFPEQIRKYADILEIVHDWEFRRKSQ